jgi:nitroreductase
MIIDSSDQLLMNLIKQRRSVRRFTGQKMDRNDLLSIIEAGTWAPTGCNNQELRFLILEQDDELNEILKFKPFLRGASAVVLIFCDMSLPMSHKMYREYKHERHLPYVDTGLALAHMVLCAKSKGIDSCIFNLSNYHLRRSRKKSIIGRWVYKAKKRLNLHARIDSSFAYCLRHCLKIPNHLEIMCGLALGFAERYPDVNTAKHGGRKIMREAVNHYIVQSNHNKTSART